MPNLPSILNGVTVEFSSSVNKSVDQKIIDALKKVVKTNIVQEHCLSKIYISSANDSHTSPSRHVQGKGKAVDISRINGMKMGSFYSSNTIVKGIVDAMQTEFENYAHRRENFGPLFKKKLGKNHTVSGHADHIHFSVN